MNIYIYGIVPKKKKKIVEYIELGEIELNER